MTDVKKSPAEVLVKARDAAMTVCVGFDEEGEDVYVGPNTAEEIAGAVLNATGTIGLIEACNPGGLESAAEQCRAAGLSAVSSALLAMANAQRSALRQASIRGGEA